MKHVFNHPPEPQNGKKYWRSLEEQADTPEFRSWLEREFPAGAAELNGDEVSRRGFLKYMGASLALAGLGLSGCRKPESHLVPFTKNPEYLVPGLPLHYATSMPRRSGHMPLLVTTYGNRPSKIEGNPRHPVSNGATDTFAQASVLDLYDPDRARDFLSKKQDAKPEAFYSWLEQKRKDWNASKGEGLAFLLEENSSPTRRRLQKEIQRQFPNAIWSVYEPLELTPFREAVQAAFGAEAKVLPDFSKAQVVLSLDSDFLNCNEDGGLAAVRGFSSGRKVEKPGDQINRLYVVESRYTNTGATADHRLAIPASRIGGYAVALARYLVEKGVGQGLQPLVNAVQAEFKPEFDAKWISAVGDDLAAHAGKCLVVAGHRQPASVQALALAINQALNNFGSTLRVVKAEPSLPSISIVQLAEVIRAKKVSTLFVLGGNPAYNAPADLEWAKLQQSIPEVAHLSYYWNETSENSLWQIPAAHYLETWGDGRSEDGTYVSIQPMILPLFGGLSEVQLLARVAGLPVGDGPELVQETFRQSFPNLKNNFEGAWHTFLYDGFVQGSAHPPAQGAVNAGNLSTLLQQNPVQIGNPTDQALEVVFAQSSQVDDGRYSNNAWMQELPEPIVKLTWDNAAWISPVTARKLGLNCEEKKGVTWGDVIRIELDGRSIEIPILFAPGHAENSITLPVGFGRHTRATAQMHVAHKVGFDVYPIRTSKNPYFAIGAKISKVGRAHDLAVTQLHHTMEGRAVAREATVEQYQKNPNLIREMGVDSHMPPPTVSMYTNPELTGKFQWGMAIDMNACVGCNACVIACQSENNIPVVGKDQVLSNREMHWLRIDRYFAGDRDNPAEVLMQPLPCMHCENAPCETVCPVNATVHDEQGLNVMTYNRCIGTRYCANNCPYKVRRFNFFDYNKRPIDQLYLGPLSDRAGVAETVKMQKNPNVTVRMRGVMEKCTFCIQRIETAKIQAKNRAKDSAEVVIPTDSFTSACAQVCPAEAIVFGDINDPNSHVSRMKKQDRNYGLLAYLNTRPRTSYLAKLRNPNKAMPGADFIGMASSDVHDSGKHAGGIEGPGSHHEEPHQSHGTGQGSGHAEPAKKSEHGGSH